jgi:hypothetical protein
VNNLLHIHFRNIEKSGIPFSPLVTFLEKFSRNLFMEVVRDIYGVSSQK